MCNLCYWPNNKHILLIENLNGPITFGSFWLIVLKNLVWICHHSNHKNNLIFMNGIGSIELILPGKYPDVCENGNKHKSQDIVIHLNMFFLVVFKYVTIATVKYIILETRTWYATMVNHNIFCACMIQVYVYYKDTSKNLSRTEFNTFSRGSRNNLL